MQVSRLQAAYTKWESCNVLNNDAENVSSTSVINTHLTKDPFQIHANQLAHAMKGCISRSRNDIPLDGSRIEGFHKALNRINYSFSSGLLMQWCLTIDFILRRNVRITLKNHSDSNPFLSIVTHGSHHLYLANFCAELTNKISATAHSYSMLPTFPNVASGETFGLVASDHILSGLSIKQEALDEEAALDDMYGSVATVDVNFDLDEYTDNQPQQGLSSVHVNIIQLICSV